VRLYQGSSHYLTGGSIPPLSTSQGNGGLKTGKALLIYKCNKYPERYFTTQRRFPMLKNINGADMPTLTVFKMELQRISDMNIEINPIITEYIRARIDEIEPPGQN
jgi:hypothetical protein|tara:strand:+ start:113 stop:430 length:318 start_codon:yes stop_codon:yes gene_type:complete